MALSFQDKIKPVQPATLSFADKITPVNKTGVPASFTYKVPETREDSLKKIQEYQTAAMKSRKEADYASSPLGLGTNYLKNLVGGIIPSEVGLGESLGAMGNTKNLESYNKNITDLTSSNIYKMKQINELEKAGKDATNLKKAYNDTAKLIEENKAAILKIQGALPTTEKLVGQLGGTALDILTAGTYGPATKAMKTGVLAPIKATTPIVKAATTAVSPELGQIATQKAGGLTSKQGLKNIVTGGGIGYGYDVTQNLQQGKTGEEAFKPGIGTAIGVGIPLLSESAESISQAKKYFTPESKNTRLIKNREKELFNIENSYVSTRKAMDYSKDANTGSRNRIASVDIWENAVGKDGKINTTLPGGAYDQYKRMTIDGKEGIVVDLLKKEGGTIAPEKIAEQLRRNIMSSGLEGKALKSALANVDDEVAGLMLRADINGQIPLVALQNAKISTTGGINYMTEPFVKSERKAVARAYKDLIEKNSTIAKPTIKEINEELSKYYKDLDLIDSLNGKIVKGGKAGKYFAQISGNIIGGAIGNMVGGPAGTAIGTVAGGELGGRIKGSILEKTLKGETGNVAPESAILKAAIEASKAPRNLPALIEGIKYKPTSGGSKYAPIQLPAWKPPLSKIENPLNKLQTEGYSKSLGSLNTQYKTNTTNINSSNIKDILPNKSSDVNVLSNIFTKEDAGLAKTIRESKGLSADDIMSKYPDIKLKKDVPAKDIHGNKIEIPQGEVLTPYEIKGNKVLLQDGQTYVVAKNQFQNIKGNSIVAEGKKFAPELEGLEETIKGSQNDNVADNSKLFELVKKNDNFEYDTTGEAIKDLVSGNLSTSNLDTNNPYDKEIIKDILNRRSTPTKYSQYTLPGGENYREVLIKAPKNRNNPTIEDGMRELGLWKNNGGNEQFSKLTENQKVLVENRIREINKIDSAKIQDFKSSHWDEPNVISHLRLNDRTYNGKKVTFMEELQSDWAREARKQGDIKPVDKLPEGVVFVQEGNTILARDKNNVLLGEGDTFAQAKENAIKFLNKDIKPTNPNLKNWQELSVKRALKEAVDNNSDYFAWTTGEQQSARYNLATHIDDIKWGDSYGVKNGNKFVKINTAENESLLINIDKNGKIFITEKNSDIPSDWEGKKLDEVLGKGLADKIMEKETGTLSGEGLKFGGEWANNLYDKQVKNIVEDLTGGKVEVIDLGLPIDKEARRFLYNGSQKGGIMAGDRVSDKTLKVGQEIYEAGKNDNYIITDILGDGKFKAVPKELFNKFPQFNSLLKGEKSLLKTKVGENWLKSQETFDIATKSTQQQGIKLNPEIKSIIKGEAPKLKKSISLPEKKNQLILENPLNNLKIKSPKKINYLEKYNINKAELLQDKDVIFNKFFNELKKNEPKFIKITEDIANNVGGDYAYRMKSPESILIKMDRRGPNFKLGNVDDALGSTVITDNIDGALAKANKDYKITNVDDLREKPTFLGYKAVHLDVELPNGQTAELQINTKEGLIRKEEGHKTYEKWREYIETAQGTTLEDIVKKIPKDLVDEFLKDVKYSVGIFDGTIPVPKEVIKTVEGRIIKPKNPLSSIMNNKKQPN